MRGQLGREIALQCLAGRVAVRPRNGEERAQNLIKRPARRFHSADCVVKIRRIWITRDGVNLGPMGRQRLIQCGGKIIIRNGVKRGQSKGRVPVLQKRVCHAVLLCAQARAQVRRLQSVKRCRVIKSAHDHGRSFT